MEIINLHLFSSEKKDIIPEVCSILNSFVYLKRGNTHIFTKDIDKLRTMSTMTSTIIIYSSDKKNYKLDIIVGGGKVIDMYNIKTDYWAESSELERLKKLIDKFSSQNNIDITDLSDSGGPNGGYYN